MMIFQVSSDELQKALNIISETSVKVSDIYEFSIFVNVLAQRQFRKQIFTEFNTALNKGFTGNIKTFLCQCLDLIRKGLIILQELTTKAKDEVLKQVNDLILQANENKKAVQEELFRIEFYQNINYKDEDPHDIPPKVKIILMEKLGVLETIQEHQQDKNNITETAKILSYMIGVNATTIKTYLLPILSPLRNDEDKNSPYKNTKNVEQAYNILNRLNYKV